MIDKNYFNKKISSEMLRIILQINVQFKHLMSISFKIRYYQ